MAIDFWSGLNIDLVFEIDEETGPSLAIVLDHDELKGVHRIELSKLLDECTTEDFDNADDTDISEIQDLLIPQYEDMRTYLLGLVKLIDEKIELANDFIREN
jgi:hypothetical protein